MNAISLLATILGIIAIGGGVTAYFGKSRGDSIIRYQAEEMELKQGTIARLKEENAALASENTSLKTQMERMERLVQGSPQLIKMTSEIKNLVQEVAKLTRRTVK